MLRDAEFDFTFDRLRDAVTLHDTLVLWEDVTEALEVLLLDTVTEVVRLFSQVSEAVRDKLFGAVALFVTLLAALGVLLNENDRETVPVRDWL